MPAITEWEVAPLFDNLPEPKQSEDIQPMEDVRSGMGKYSCTVPHWTEDVNGTLHIDEVHDWAQVFADGKLLGRLDRRRGEFTLPLNGGLKKGTQPGYSWLKPWDV